MNSLKELSTPTNGFKLLSQILWAILILIFCYALSLFGSSVYALEQDKKMHMAISSTLAMGGYTVCKTTTKMSKLGCALTAGTTVATIGGMKEIADTHNSNSEHAKDMGANALGIALGIGVSLPW